MEVSIQALQKFAHGWNQQQITRLGTLVLCDLDVVVLTGSAIEVLLEIHLSFPEKSGHLRADVVTYGAVMASCQKSDAWRLVCQKHVRYS